MSTAIWGLGSRVAFHAFDHQGFPALKLGWLYTSYLGFVGCDLCGDYVGDLLSHLRDTNISPGRT